MTEVELREKIGIGADELVNSSAGAIEIFGIVGDTVSYGMLATGSMHNEPVSEFLARFK